MARTLPKTFDTFLLADSLRPDVGNKATILGAFAAGRITLSPAGSLPAAFPLALYVVFADGEGKFRAEVRITTPSGKIDTHEIGQVEKLPVDPMQISVNFQNFIVEELGDFTFELLLDGHAYLKRAKIDRARAL